MGKGYAEGVRVQSLAFNHTRHYQNKSGNDEAGVMAYSLTVITDIVRRAVMIGYITLGTADVERGAAFYDAIAKGMDTPRMMGSVDEGFIAWGKVGGPQ